MYESEREQDKYSHTIKELWTWPKKIKPYNGQTPSITEVG